MNGLDLFSGIGGISIALEPWIRTVAYCERERYAQAVLLSRMADGHLPVAPIWDDVTTLKGDMLPPIDIIFGGFPCQDISSAGAGRGLDGERSGLFFEIVRLAAETKPAFVFLENVPAIRTRGLHTVVEKFSQLGFQSRWICLSAQEVGANHKRERWFFLASHSDVGPLWNESEWLSRGREESIQRQRKTKSRDDGKEKHLANAEGGGFESGRDDGNDEIQRTHGTEMSNHRSREAALAHAECDGLERCFDEVSGQREAGGGRRPPDESSSGIRRRGDVADSASVGCEGRRSGSGGETSSSGCGLHACGCRENLADADGSGLEHPCEMHARRERQPWRDTASGRGWWDVEPDVGRVAHGVPFRVDRLKCLGNSVVSIQVREAFKELMGLDR